VCGYFGAVGNSGAANVWASNALVRANTGYFGSTHILQGWEFDSDNFDKDVLLANTSPANISAPASIGVTISGDNTGIRNTAGLGLNGGKWQFGITSFADVSQALFYGIPNVSAVMGLNLEGTYTGTAIGVGLNNNVPVAGTLEDLRVDSTGRFIMRGKQSLADGIVLSFNQ
jgi:hypothetical protein